MPECPITGVMSYYLKLLLPLSKGEGKKVASLLMSDEMG